MCHVCMIYRVIIYSDDFLQYLATILLWYLLPC